MNTLSDQQLLRAYAGTRSEEAFAELVRRHVDLVHSAALRMVRDSHQAEDVTQGAFLALAQNAPQLTDRPVLSGWLHRTAQNLASKAVRSDVRRRAREQEAATMNELLSAGSEASWDQVAPHLDAALGELSESDRDALLLRYFERKSAREMAETLGISDEAAQRRVTRAVERLREFFAQRGIAAGASGLVAVISANAVQAAPVGLAITISTGATLAGTTIAATTTATAIEAIAMTTLQKVIIAATLAVAVGTGIYQARQNANLRTQVQTLQQQPSPSADQIRKLQQERDDAIAGQVALQQENARLQQTVAEVPKLRGEVARLRTAPPQQAQRKPGGLDANDPAVQGFLTAKAQAEQIARYLTQMPDKTIPELKLLTEVDWLSATKEAKFDTDADVRKTLAWLRSLAKNRMPLGQALDAFTRANNGQLPTEVSQLKPYFKSALGDTPLDDAGLDAILGRYKLLHAGNLSDFSPDTWFIAEKAPVDKDYDSRAKFGNGRATIVNTGVGEAGDPDDKSY